MSKDQAELLDRVLALPGRDRALFAERILASLDDPPDPDADIEAAWREEIHRRAEELDSGRVVAVPWEEARARLHANLRAKP